MKIVKIFFLVLMTNLFFLLPLQAQEDLPPYEKVIEIIDLGDGFKLLKLEDGSVIRVRYELADKIDLKVIGSVTYNQDKKEYLYEYSLFSSTNSVQNVWNFMIIVSNEKLIKDVQAIKGWYEPVNPKDWTDFLSWRNVVWVSWGAPTEAQVRPGSSASGFKFTSISSLPGIVDYYAEGDTEPPCFQPGEAIDYIPGYDDHTPYGPGTVGKTIGPVPIPKPFNPISFIGSLTSLNEKCYSLSWIKGTETKQALKKILLDGKRQLEKGQIISAKNTLLAFIDKIEENKERLTPEAYGVLKFNGKYLIENLKK